MMVVIPHGQLVEGVRELPVEQDLLLLVMVVEEEVDIIMEMWKLLLLNLVETRAKMDMLSLKYK